MTETFTNVFEALESDIEIIENLRIKSELMIAIENYIKINKLTQKKAAKLMSVSQPRISDLVRGKIGLFTIDMLVNMSAKAGLKIKFSVDFENVSDDTEIHKDVTTSTVGTYREGSAVTYAGKQNQKVISTSVGLSNWMQ